MHRTVVLSLMVMVAFLGFAATASANCTNPPVAHDDVYNMSMNGTINIYFADLASNDTDADGDSLSAYVSGAPSTGSFCGIAPTGVCYQPPTGFTGLVSIPYEVTDGCNTDGGDVFIFVQ